MRWWRRGVEAVMRDPRRVADPIAWEDARRRWNGVCAYKYVVPHRCEGGLQPGHQWAHSKWGRSSGSNTQPECAFINRYKSGMSNVRFVWYYATPTGKVIYCVRWFVAEVVRRRRYMDGGI